MPIVDLEIRHLRLVAGIADAGTMTGAATRLHLTQSALSHQLRDIEARLGTALFVRLGRSMVLTAPGSGVLERARRRAGGRPRRVRRRPARRYKLASFHDGARSHPWDSIFS